MGKTITGCRKCCYNCSEECACFEISVSGVTNNDCDQCGQVNGTFNLQNTGANCQYGGREVLASGICGSGLPEGGWRFGYDFDNDEWRLTNQLMGSGNYYQIGFDDVNCANVIEDTTCEEDYCPSGNPPQCYEVIFEGITNNMCTDCDSWNGTYILEKNAGCSWSVNMGIKPRWQIFGGGNCTESQMSMTYTPIRGSNGNICANLNISAPFLVGVIDWNDTNGDDNLDCSIPRVLDNRCAFGVILGNACNNFPTSVTVNPVPCPNGDATLVGSASGNCINWPSTVEIVGAPCVSSSENCSQCPDGMSECWELVVPEITPLSPPTSGCCAELAGVYTLVHNPDSGYGLEGCSFESNETSPICLGTPSESPRFSLGYNSVFDRWQLNISMDGGIRDFYSLGSEDWNCNGPNTLNTSMGTYCNWPSTLTIEPIGC